MVVVHCSLSSIFVFVKNLHISVVSLSRSVSVVKLLGSGNACPRNESMALLPIDVKMCFFLTLVEYSFSNFVICFS